MLKIGMLLSSLIFLDLLIGLKWTLAPFILKEGGDGLNKQRLGTQ